MALELLQYQREQLQVIILNPLQEIKADIGRRLQRKEVQIIKSFLTKDIHSKILEKAIDGEVLFEIIQEYYGKDSLKFIARLLSKAKCQDLVEMLQDWKSNNKIMGSNIFHQFGFFPLWIKVNYSFNEFSKSRPEIFKTLKNVFAIPQPTDDNPASDCMVYMGVSLGKRDVLVSVLVPYCVRQSIRTSLQYQDTSIKLRNVHVTGIYFSRIKNKNSLTGSDLSISSAMSSDFGELCDAAFEDLNNNSITTRNASILEDHQPPGLYKDQNLINNQSKKLHTNSDEKAGDNLIPYNNSEKVCYRNHDNQSVSSVHTYIDNSADMHYRNHGNYSVSSARPYEDDSANMNSRSHDNHSTSSVPPYGGDVNTHIDGPKLVRANYGYINAPPKLDSTSTASDGPEKLSYGACFFVDKNSSPKRLYPIDRRTPQGSVESNDSDRVEAPDRASPFPANDVHQPYSGCHGNAFYSREYDVTQETPKSDDKIMHYSQRAYFEVENPSINHSLARESPWSNQEDMLFSRKTEFSFEEPTKFDSDHERELHDWSRNFTQNDQETDEDPSFWYQPRPKNDIHPQNNLPKQPQQERDSNPGYWWDDEHGSSYHGDHGGYYGNEQVRSDFKDFHNLEDMYRQGLLYQEDSVGNHRDDESPSNHAGNYQDVDNQKHGYYGDYHGNEQVGSSQTHFVVSSDHRYDEGQPPSYYRNESTIHENEHQRFMEPEPETRPMTSRLPPEERNRQAAAVHQSTPSSSSSGFFTADQSVIPSADKLSRSMPSLHVKQNDMFDAPHARWSDSRHSNGYHGNYLDDEVFIDTRNNSVKFKVAPPPYCPPPDYKETMIRKSYLSLSSVSLDSKRMRAKSPLLSSQSVTSIYKEKESLLSREELRESIRSAEEKQWEILLEKSKEFLIAAKMGDEEEVRNVLEEEDVDVDYKNEFGHTALMVASREGHVEVIRVLIAHGADLNIQDKYGKSALHEAAWSGKHQVINALLSNEAEMNFVDEEGRTPLQYASLRGKSKVVEVLLRFGAEDSIPNKDGESAVEIAYRCRHKDIVKMLLKSTDKKTRKDMKGKIRKQKIQRIRTATSLPNLTKATSLKTVRRSRSKPDINKKTTCVIQ